MRRTKLAPLIVGLLSALACRPDLGDAPSRIDGPRILAVVAEPPDAAPGAKVTLRAIVADASGPVAASGAQWSFCAAPKPLTENGTVSVDCVSGAATRAVDGPGDGDSIDATLPADGCALFGPDTPPGGYRPRDADGTGGFYQPLRLDVGGALAFPLVRIRCNLANASVDIARAFAATYVANRNPHLLTVEARVDGALVPLEALPAGRTVTFSTSWPAEDAESYVAFDPASRALVTRREAMRVGWFSNVGSFASDSTGRAEGDLATTSENLWSAPDTAVDGYLWVVLRDARGGIVTTANAVRVAP